MGFVVGGAAGGGELREPGSGGVGPGEGLGCVGDYG